jgi:hypothetical protein
MLLILVNNSNRSAQEKAVSILHMSLKPNIEIAESEANRSIPLIGNLQ